MHYALVHSFIHKVFLEHPPRTKKYQAQQSLFLHESYGRDNEQVNSLSCFHSYSLYLIICCNGHLLLQVFNKYLFTSIYVVGTLKKKRRIQPERFTCERLVLEGFAAMDPSTLGPSTVKEPGMGTMTRRVSEEEGTKWMDPQGRKEL